VCVYVCVCVCVYVCVHVCVCVGMPYKDAAVVCVCAYIHTYIRMHTYTCACMHAASKTHILQPTQLHHPHTNPPTLTVSLSLCVSLPPPLSKRLCSTSRTSLGDLIRQVVDLKKLEYQSASLVPIGANLSVQHEVCICLAS